MNSQVEHSDHDEQMRHLFQDAVKESTLTIEDSQQVTSLRFADLLNVTKLKVKWSYCLRFLYCPLLVTELSASNCKIQVLDGLQQMAQLRDLDLSYNAISELSALGSLANLRELNLMRNCVSDVRPLARLTSLVSLQLSRNQIEDVSPLSGLKNLQRLLIFKNQIRDLQPLRQLTNILQLNIDENQLEDVSPLRFLVQMQNLSAAKNRIRDICAFKFLKNLVQLNLSWNQLVDVSSIRYLQSLQLLYIAHNLIINIDFIKNLKNVAKIDVENNKINYVNIIKLIKNCRYENQQVPSLSDVKVSNNQIRKQLQINFKKVKIKPEIQYRNLEVKQIRQRKRQYIKPYSKHLQLCFNQNACITTICLMNELIIHFISQSRIHFYQLCFVFQPYNLNIFIIFNLQQYF
ncbi:Conserved_hypothetical protein [Hexamita inflata]|uniref:Uncharacterized protein n=1 Tax=Hexamita inflata TaxID=28002 RepID=A0AA86US11_9EUKA|nr:Conserved hypothetical protein [Hexamita inflata]